MTHLGLEDSGKKCGTSNPKIAVVATKDFKHLQNFFICILYYEILWQAILWRLFCLHGKQSMQAATFKWSYF